MAAPDLLGGAHSQQEQLEPLLATADIRAHLAQLSHLYEGTSPALSRTYAELAPLSPESLSGARIEKLSSDPQACSPSGCFQPPPAVESLMHACVVRHHGKLHA
jgi:hypothetical protein